MCLAPVTPVVSLMSVWWPVPQTRSGMPESLARRLHTSLLWKSAACCTRMSGGREGARPPRGNDWKAAAAASVQSVTGLSGGSYVASVASTAGNSNNSGGAGVVSTSSNS